MDVKAAAFPRRGLQHTEDGAFRMLARKILEVEYLRQLFDFDPATGALWWKHRGPETFDSDTPVRIVRNWNARFAGKPAFTTITKRGYRAGAINNLHYYGHVILWVLVHGKWPEGEIDHINGDKADNRIENLREVSRSGNSRNLPRFSSNTSGHTGVTWVKNVAKWGARIRVLDNTHYLGLYRCVTAAAVARKRAERIFGFHENHGRAK